MIRFRLRTTIDIYLLQAGKLKVGDFVVAVCGT
jgi:hypothetical protein